MKERMNYIVLAIALISLVISIIALVDNSEEDSDTDIKEELLGSCSLRSGPIPDTSDPRMANCEEACNFVRSQKCIFGVIKKGAESLVIGCQNPLGQQSNFLETSYECICC